MVYYDFHSRQTTHDIEDHGGHHPTVLSLVDASLLFLWGCVVWHSSAWVDGFCEKKVAEWSNWTAEQKDGHIKNNSSS